MTDKVFLLERDYKPEATLGQLCDGDNVIFRTLEPPNRNNAKDNPNTPANEAGCIPEGEYLCVKRDPKVWAKARFKDNWEIKNVPNKAGVVFHSGNYWFHSQSCILVGKEIKDLNPKNDPKIDKNKRWFLSDSGTALKEFYKIMPERFILKIVNNAS